MVKSLVIAPRSRPAFGPSRRLGFPQERLATASSRQKLFRRPLLGNQAHPGDRFDLGSSAPLPVSGRRDDPSLYMGGRAAIGPAKTSDGIQHQLGGATAPPP